jgi:hypothetical protein
LENSPLKSPEPPGFAEPGDFEVGSELGRFLDEGVGAEAVGALDLAIRPQPQKIVEWATETCVLEAVGPTIELPP